MSIARTLEVPLGAIPSLSFPTKDSQYPFVFVFFFFVVIISLLSLCFSVYVGIYNLHGLVLPIFKYYRIRHNVCTISFSQHYKIYSCHLS